jgi:hypothetical protein
MPSATALLADPDVFFRDRGETASLRSPALVVTLSVVVGLVSTYVTYRGMSTVLSSAGVDSTILLVTQIGSLAAAIIGPYLTWVLYAGAFHVISLLFDGEGEFRTTLALVGWGFVPAVVEGVVGAVLTAYRWEVRGVTADLPATVDFTNQADAAQFQSAIQEMTSGPIVALTVGLGIVFTLWSGLLWTFAVKHARKLSLRDAALTVVLPVLVSVGLSTWSLLNALL